MGSIRSLHSSEDIEDVLLADITSLIVVKKVTDKIVSIDVDLNFSRILRLADMLSSRIYIFLLGYDRYPLSIRINPVFKYCRSVSQGYSIL
jgi:hypothetical protein